VVCHWPLLYVVEVDELGCVVIVENVISVKVVLVLVLERRGAEVVVVQGVSVEEGRLVCEMVVSEALVDEVKVSTGLVDGSARVELVLDGVGTTVTVFVSISSPISMMTTVVGTD
jgi:hypothetical protein